MKREISVSWHRWFLEFWSAFRFLTPIVLAAAVGIATSFIAVGFIKLVELCRHLFFVQGAHILGVMGSYYVLLVPAIGGLMVGPLVTYFAPEAKGHGVPEVLKAIAIRGGKIRPVVVIVKAMASVLSLGSGFSVGREGPIVQVGSALGSTTGQLLGLNASRIKNLIACGAASGIAAVFNAPIAGVMFASEVILKDFGANALTTVVVAAVSSSIISQIFLGQSPAFVVPSYHLASPWEIFIYLGLGILSAFIAVFFIYLIQRSEDIWEKFNVPEWIKPCLGGLLVGGIGLYFPQIFGSGFTTIEGSLRGSLPFVLLVVLVVVKMMATSISLGAGSSGGVFAPALFVGAVLGGAVGQLVSHHFAFPVESSGAYALVGMACVFAAAAHAPVTAILIIFEMTSNYHLILPIMASVVVATLVSQTLHRESIYTIKLKQKGIDIGFLEEVRVLSGLQVKDAMTKDFFVAADNMPIRDLILKMANQPGKTVITVNREGRLIGIIKYEEIQKYLCDADADAFLVADITLNREDHCFDNDHLVEVTQEMVKGRLVCLPVLDSGDRKKILGVLRPEDVLRVYSHQALHRSKIDEAEKNKVFFPDRNIIIDSFVVSSPQLIGKPIKDLELPRGVRFSYVKRGSTYALPYGNFILQARDKVWVVLMSLERDKFKQWLRQHTEP